MSETKVRVTGGGVSLLSVLGVIFIVLKLLRLGDVADWPWWKVLMPFWGPVAMAGAVVGTLGAAWLVVATWEWLDNRRRAKRRATAATAARRAL